MDRRSSSVAVDHPAMVQKAAISSSKRERKGGGTSEHAFLEFDLRRGVRPAQLVAAAAGLVDPLSSAGGVNLAIGFRPEMWARVADPEEVMRDAHG